MKQNDCILICNRFVRERNRSVDIFSTFPFQTGTEQNDCVSFYFHISFLVVPFVGTDRSI